ncbi:MAG: FAD-dependent oxidoreductase [Phycisphaerae bacterium]|nr:FAD-dependent oxidoreductase [Gemmatimonadaceae bacterium]
MDAVIVGAGIAGLVCALELTRSGRSVSVLESEPEVGGRVRTTWQNGVAIDHGFQVLFTAYPVLTSYLDLPALELRRFRPAGHVVTSTGEGLIGDALRDPSLLIDAVRPGVVSLTDKLRLLALRHFARGLSVGECFGAKYVAMSTRTFLVQRGFSPQTIDGFFAPFYGGILLDRTLSAHAGVLLFTFKMLAEGDTAVPARGMGAISQQLADQLPAGVVRTGQRVQRVRTENGQATGVSLQDASVVDAKHVVLATDAPVTATLALTAGSAASIAASGLGSTTLYYTARTAPLPGRSLWLNAAVDAVISHTITLTEVAPEYAPGIALLAATAVGPAANEGDAVLDLAARRELAQMARVAGLRELPLMTLVTTRRVPFSQFAQPPGTAAPGAVISSNVRGLWRASETMHSSSLEGAARGGQMAARAIMAERP